MKAVRFDHYGGPEVLEVREVERPALAAGEVLVGVKAAAINPGDNTTSDDANTLHRIAGRRDVALGSLSTMAY